MHSTSTKMLEEEAVAAAANGDFTKYPFSEINRRDISEVFKQRTPSENTLLHVAAKSGQVDMTEMMVSEFPFLIHMVNCKGDSALHVAARAGKVGTVTPIVNHRRPTDGAALLKLKNERGSTALHEALYALKDATKAIKRSSGSAAASSSMQSRVDDVVSTARFLVTADPDTCYLQNNEGNSPLCLAVLSGNTDILDYMLNALPRGADIGSKLQGKSPVQAAIEKRSLEMLERIEKLQPDLFRIRDKQENTPMHWAASIGYVPGVGHLYNSDRNNALPKNNKGEYPLHLACQNDRVGVMDLLLNNWPDPTELYNGKNQNILHVAAKSGKCKAVRRILKASYNNELIAKQMINERDGDGNAPLHLAALDGHILVVGNLLLSGAKMDIFNNAGLSPYDVAEDQSAKLNPEFSGNAQVQGLHNVDDNEKEVKLQSEREPEPNVSHLMMTLAVLFTAHNISSYFHGDNFGQSCVDMIENLRKKSRQKPSSDDVNKRITNLMIVAALIAGAAYAASVQIGSSNSDITPRAAGSPPPDPNAVDKKQTALTFFTVCNTAAMYVSITAAIVLCWAQLQDTHLAAMDVWIASLMVAFALYMSCFAFFASIYMMTDLDNAFLVTMMVLQGLFLLFLSIRSFQLLVPFSLKKLFILYVYLYQAVIYYFAYSVSVFFRERCCRCCRVCCFGREDQ